MIEVGDKVRTIESPNNYLNGNAVTGVVTMIVTEAVNSPVAVVRDASGREHNVYTWALESAS